MAKIQNQFERRDDAIKRNRTVRWIYFWLHHTIVYCFFLLILKGFYVQDLFWLIFGSDETGEICAFVAVITLSLSLTILLFLYKELFKWLVAVVDQNQVMVANNLNPFARKRNLIPYGPGLNPKLPWEILGQDPKLQVSLEEKEYITPEDKPETSPTLDGYNMSFRLSFNYNADIENVISVIQIGLEVARNTVRDTAIAVVRSTFRYLTSDEALKNVGAIIELATAILETEDLDVLNANIRLIVMQKFQFDSSHNTRQQHLTNKSQKDIIQAISGYAAEQLRSVRNDRIKNGLGADLCSITRYLGTQVQFLKVFDVDYPKDVQAEQSKLARFTLLRKGLCIVLGLPINASEEAVERAYQEVKKDKAYHIELTRMTLNAAGFADYKTEAKSNTSIVQLGDINATSVAAFLEILGKHFGHSRIT